MLRNLKLQMFMVLLVTVSAAASSGDQLQFTEVLPGPNTTMQPVNMTEDDTAESSGGTDSLNCTCNDITCSNCGLVYNFTNLLPDVTAIRFFEEVESADGEGKKYLEVHFCQLIGIRIVISNIGVSDQ